jgi:hypothetical protein
MIRRNKPSVSHLCEFFRGNGGEITILDGLSSSGWNLKEIHAPILTARPSKFNAPQLAISARVSSIVVGDDQFRGKRQPSITAFPQAIRRIP